MKPSRPKTGYLPQDGRSGASAPPALPCLNKSISDEPASSAENVLTPQHKKTAYALIQNVLHFVQVYGMNYVGFMTLTFPDRVKCAREAQRRFNNLARRVLKARYRDYIRVLERHESGCIHYHLLVALPADIRTGTDMSRVSRRNYRAANAALRDEWAFLRESLGRYHFGRHELLPIKTNGDGIARYLGKYIAKHIGNRLEEDKGVRLVANSRHCRICTTRFAWVSPRSWLWRAKLKKIATRLNAASMDEMKAKYGNRWCYRLREAIPHVALDYWPDVATCRADGQDPFRELPETAVDIRVTYSRLFP